MNPTGRSHEGQPITVIGSGEQNCVNHTVGPYRASATEDPAEVESRQRLTCANRGECLRLAAAWSGMSCRAPNGQWCTGYAEPDPFALACERVELAAIGGWIWRTRDEVGVADARLEAVRAALKANPTASISEISRLTGSARAFVSRVRRLGR